MLDFYTGIVRRGIFEAPEKYFQECIDKIENVIKIVNVSIKIVKNEANKKGV